MHRISQFHSFILVMVLPRISRWKHKPADLAHSLPVSIGMAMPRNKNSSLTGFALEPKTSLADRKGVLVPPLPRTNSGRRDDAATDESTITATTRTPAATAYYHASKSISSQSKDPGESLTVPEEEDDEDEDRRRNAYRILQRQSDVPDETMWRSLAG
ncbi:hypothetical protein BS47DRAFT_1337004 [Hydnum rufescens UP504]|uniref:Uncharacterized protein n=1 Tax=Hydnum rufescens UP504 TaxID=1448309 RepID=A0A9P6B9T6_9AGAM|nr:hypothetical protein BS47DRAFT_1337004 [Hydnum rufescens UP504]